MRGVEKKGEQFNNFGDRRKVGKFRVVYFLNYLNIFV
jgi:hypothetical protein